MYVADDLWARFRGRPVERIRVGRLYAAVNHWNEVEYSVGTPVIETCVDALMPHFGYLRAGICGGTPSNRSVRKLSASRRTESLDALRRVRRDVAFESKPPRQLSVLLGVLRFPPVAAQ